MMLAEAAVSYLHNAYFDMHPVLYYGIGSLFFLFMLSLAYQVLIDNQLRNVNKAWLSICIIIFGFVFWAIWPSVILCILCLICCGICTSILGMFKRWRRDYRSLRNS